MINFSLHDSQMHVSLRTKWDFTITQLSTFVLDETCLSILISLQTNKYDGPSENGSSLIKHVLSFTKITNKFPKALFPEKNHLKTSSLGFLARG